MPNADFTPSFNPSDIDTNYGSTGGDITVPTFHELKPFRFWCQKALPLVYDDSLSYYELLCKVVDLYPCHLSASFLFDLFHPFAYGCFYCFIVHSYLAELLYGTSGD
jgi:hypothetical protein